MKFPPSIRLTFLFLALACAGMMLTAVLYFQKTLELHPCPLCISQRIFVVLVGLTGLIAFIHNPATVGRRIYGILATLLAIIGGSISGRHIWLQSLPADQAPACGPGLTYMFETFPVIDALKLLFQGDGNCADVVWSLFGLSIPGWTLVGFVFLALVGIFQIVRMR